MGCVEKATPLSGKHNCFCVEKATPLSGKHKGSLCKNQHLPKENTTVLYGKAYTSLRKTQRFCMENLHLPLESTRIPCGESYTSVRKTNGVCLEKITPSS